jgi:hypothetical protein
VLPDLPEQQEPALPRAFARSDRHLDEGLLQLRRYAGVAQEHSQCRPSRMKISVDRSASRIFGGSFDEIQSIAAQRPAAFDVGQQEGGNQFLARTWPLPERTADPVSSRLVALRDGGSSGRRHFPFELRAHRREAVFHLGRNFASIEGRMGRDLFVVPCRGPSQQLGHRPCAGRFVDEHAAIEFPADEIDRNDRNVTLRAGTARQVGNFRVHGRMPASPTEQPEANRDQQQVSDRDLSQSEPASRDPH